MDRRIFEQSSEVVIIGSKHINSTKRVEEVERWVCELLAIRETKHGEQYETITRRINYHERYLVELKRLNEKQDEIRKGYKRDL